MIQTNRRKLLQLLMGGIALSTLPVKASNLDQELLIASAARDSDNNAWLVVMNDQGQLRVQHPLPARAHHVAIHPTRPWVMVVARRPGHYIDLVDLNTGELIRRIAPEQGRHFFGHALFTPDGKGIYATEMDVASGEGRITLRYLNSISDGPVRDMSSGGIGPHELLMSPDQQTLIIANGGILTQGREKLNLASMQPSLAYLELASGRIVEQHFLQAEDHQLGIRHIDVNSKNEVIIALQYEGNPQDDKALVAVHRRGSPLKLLHAPDRVNRSMEQYAGSARFDSAGRIAAVSAPRGNMVTYWDLEQDRFLASLPAMSGCGITATQEPGCFIASTGHGKLYLHYPEDDYYELLPTPPELPALAWDNHMALFGMTV